MRSVVVVFAGFFFQSVLGVLILLLSSKNINYKENQKSADVMNDMVLALSFTVAVLNVVLNTIDLKPIPKQVNG
jgi:hypothetical protein